MNLEKEWNEFYNLAKSYYNENGDLNIPKNYEVKNGFIIYQLGAWLTAQRRLQTKKNKTKTEIKKIELLNKIGMIWDCYEYNWNFYYELAKEYYEKNGNLIIPQSYKVKKDNKNYNLGTWIVTQRMMYKKECLNDIYINRVNLLNKIGMIWDYIDLLSDRWNIYYELAKEYYEKNGNLLIPKTYSVKKDNEDYNLGTWIGNQRNMYKKENSSDIYLKRIELLNKIGMVWDINKYNLENISQDWLEKYAILKEYYIKYEDILYIDNVKDKDDETIDELKKWVKEQRNLYKNKTLNEKKIKMLEELFIVWEPNSLKKIQRFVDSNYIENEQEKLKEYYADQLMSIDAFKFIDEDVIKSTVNYIIHKRNNKSS